MTAPWTPRLRDDVALDVDATPAVLVDATFGRRIPVGPLTRAVVAHLDGQRSAAAVIAAAAAAHGASEPDAEEALRALLLLALLDGAHPDAVARARAIAAGEPTPAPETLPEARFGCQGSGQCCRVYRPGPLTDDDVAGLEAIAPALRAALPGLPAGAFHESRPSRGGRDDERDPTRSSDGTWRYLRRRDDGRCVFLQADARCGVHAVAGREAKPEACRLFPFALTRTLSGVRVVDVSECSAFADASRTGPAHADAAAEVARLAPARPRLHHPLVALDRGTPSDYAPILALEATLLEVAAAESDAARRLSRCAAIAQRLATALIACPLAPGEPAATTAAVLAAAHTTPPLAAPDPADLAYALEAVASALDTTARTDGEGDAPLAEAFQDALGAARSFAADRAGLGDGPLPPLLAAAAALPADAGEAALLDATLGASTRNRLFGSRLLAEGRLPAGVLRLALIHTLTRVGARIRAASAGAATVRAQDVSAGHWIAALNLSRPALARALAPVEGHAWVVAAGALTVGAPAAD